MTPVNIILGAVVAYMLIKRGTANASEINKDVEDAMAAALDEVAEANPEPQPTAEAAKQEAEASQEPAEKTAAQQAAQVKIWDQAYMQSQPGFKNNSTLKVKAGFHSSKEIRSNVIGLYGYIAIKNASSHATVLSDIWIKSTQYQYPQTSGKGGGFVSFPENSSYPWRINTAYGDNVYEYTPQLIWSHLYDLNIGLAPQEICYIPLYVEVEMFKNNLIVTKDFASAPYDYSCYMEAKIEGVKAESEPIDLIINTNK